MSRLMRSTPDVEALAKPEVRAKLPFRFLLWLYLDPFALLKDATVGTPRMQALALDYNRRHRRMLLAYARRWAVIALGCVMSVAPLDALARSQPAMCVPLVGAQIAFSIAFVVLLLSLTVYVYLSVDESGL